MCDWQQQEEENILYERDTWYMGLLKILKRYTSDTLDSFCYWQQIGKTFLILKRYLIYGTSQKIKMWHMRNLKLQFKANISREKKKNIRDL